MAVLHMVLEMYVLPACKHTNHDLHEDGMHELLQRLQRWSQFAHGALRSNTNNIHPSYASDATFPYSAAATTVVLTTEERHLNMLTWQQHLSLPFVRL